MRTRYQTGCVYAARKRATSKGKKGTITAFHVRYYTTDVIEGLPTRVQKSEKLCDRDDLHFSPTCPAVSELAAKVMARVNTKDHQLPLKNDQPVVEFFERRFLPYCKEVLPITGLPRFKPSTVRTYERIWKRHLRDHFGAVTLQRYDPDAGTQFFETLVGTQCKTTLKAIKSVGLLIFKRAGKDKIITANTFTKVAMPEDAIDPEPTEHYTVDEAEAIIAALEGHADCQLVMALACFLGLRPGEITGLQWGDARTDADGEWLHIERSVVRGLVGTPKTKSSVRKLPMIARVRHYWDAWRKVQQDNPAQWVFPNAAGDGTIALHNLEWRIIIPTLKAKGLTWKSFYAGRRCAATFIIEETGGNYVLAQALMGHKSMKTTLDIYKKMMTPAGFQKGMLSASRALKRLQS
jgi:integrase